MPNHPNYQITSILNSLKNIDTQLFLWLNHQNSDWADFVFWWVSNKYIWIPFYLIIIFFIVKIYKKQAFYYILSIILAVSTADFFASTILKPFIKRLRPTHEPAIQDLVRVLHNYRGGDYGMASSHAANAFALAMILWLFFSKKVKFLRLIFVWSFTVAYSRVYIGVHYPSDILAGAFIGIGCAYLSKNLFNYLKPTTKA